MRKKVVILLTLVMAISLAGCSSSKLNDNNTRTGKAIINAIDAYLDGTADLRTTYNTVEAESSNVDDTDENESDYLYFSIDVNSLCIHLNPSVGDHDVSKITEYRDDLASRIGESKYK